MGRRIDTASRLVSASPREVYSAFSEPGAIERWLPPSGMRGEMMHFDFREGGSYRMRLTYINPELGRGKSSVDSDEVKVRLIRLGVGRRIEQEVTFESDDPAFAGVMRMIWRFQPVQEGTLVTVRAENVPEGILPEDHEAGMNASLNNLAEFLVRER